MLLYDIVGPGSSLTSAVRLNATARYLGVLVGPRCGQHHRRDGSGRRGGGHLRQHAVLPAPPALAGERTLRPALPRRRRRAPSVGPSGASPTSSRPSARACAGCPWSRPWCCLAGAASSSPLATATRRRCRASPRELGHGDPGLAYTLLLGADAAGALLAGVLLETRGTWLGPTTAASALKMAFLWGCSLFAFSFMSWYPAAICVLFVAGVPRALLQQHDPGPSCS